MVLGATNVQPSIPSHPAAILLDSQPCSPAADLREPVCPKAISGGSALSGGTAPHAVAASSEVWRATEEGDDCNCKRSSAP
jgi:hypothetical protein